MFARVMPAKGVNDYAVKVLSNELGQLGHRELIFKSDGEPATKALKSTGMGELRGRPASSGPV